MIEILDSDSDDEREQAPPPPSPPPANPEPEQASTSNQRRSSNPFAAFAFDDDDGPAAAAAEEGGGDENEGPLPTTFTADPFSSSTATKRPAPPPAASAAAAPNSKKRATLGSTATGKRHECGPPEDFDAIGEREREAVYRKWMGIVDGAARATSSTITSTTTPPPPVDEATWRFRLLAAVILSSRTQESMVRQAVQRMAAMPGGGFSVAAMASIDPNDTSPLHERISFVHCNKVKSRHIVLSARRIRDELQGQVPTDMAGLLQCHGIGPTLAPLLVFLFQYRAQKQKEKEKAQESVDAGESKAGGKDEEEVVVLVDDIPEKTTDKGSV